MKPTIKVKHPFIAVLSLALGAFLLPGPANADIITYNLSNHPAAGDAFPTIDPFGLRLDGLLTGSSGEVYLFDFNNAGSSMQLAWDTNTNFLQISGSAYGGQDADSEDCGGGCIDNNGDGFVDGTEAWWAIDFLYDTNVSLPGDPGPGFDDIIVGSPGHVNFGTISSSLGEFMLRDHYSDFFGSSFQLGDETDDSGHRDFPGISGWGWLDYCDVGLGECSLANWSGSDQNGPFAQPYTSDWLFVASPVPVPAAVWLFGSGLLGMIALARRRRT